MTTLLELEDDLRRSTQDYLVHRLSYDDYLTVLRGIRHDAKGIGLRVDSEFLTIVSEAEFHMAAEGPLPVPPRDEESVPTTLPVPTRNRRIVWLWTIYLTLALGMLLWYT